MVYEQCGLVENDIKYNSASACFANIPHSNHFVGSNQIMFAYQKLLILSPFGRSLFEGWTSINAEVEHGTSEIINTHAEGSINFLGPKAW